MRVNTGGPEVRTSSMKCTNKSRLRVIMFRPLFQSAIEYDDDECVVGTAMRASSKIDFVVVVVKLFRALAVLAETGTACAADYWILSYARRFLKASQTQIAVNQPTMDVVLSTGAVLYFRFDDPATLPYRMYTVIL